MLTPSPRTALGLAHSKLILVGEHSVVYGKPAIALPFPLLDVKAYVTENKGSIQLDCKYYKGPLVHIPHKMRGISACIYETLQRLGKPNEDFTIKLESHIPVGRGLGSSAAIAIAIVKSLFRYFKQDLTRTELLELVHIAETVAHGNPSGIDMEAASSDCPIWFQREKQVIPLQINAAFYLVVADTGRIGNTRSAVEGIRALYDSNYLNTKRSLDLLEDYTYKTRDALLAGDIKSIGPLMRLSQIELKKLGVSDDGIDQLIAAADKAEALGAKLTGGGRGGCVIALAKNMNHAEMIASQLVKAGAAQAWSYKVDDHQLDRLVSKI